MKKINVVTIDGPSASGKGALTRKIALDLGFNVLDSGALYRLYAYFSNMKLEEIDIIKKIKNEVTFSPEKRILNIFHKEKDITKYLRSEKIAKIASSISSKKNVRNSLFDLQRSFYNDVGLVADGRDMGTVVFRDAKLKIFLTASSEVRAKRRYLELQNSGQEVNMPDLIADINERDIKDSSRELSPLLPADEAHIIDSSEMSLEDVFRITENLIKKEFK